MGGRRTKRTFDPINGVHARARVTWITEPYVRYVRHASRLADYYLDLDDVARLLQAGGGS